MQYRAPERRYIGERGAAVKRFLCVLMTLVLLLGSGQAEFAPLFSALDQYSEEGNALLWQLSASVTELPDASDAAMEALGGLPPVKVHCSLLAEQAVNAALWDYAKKNNITIEGLKPPVDDVDELHDHGDEEEDE